MLDPMFRRFTHTSKETITSSGRPKWHFASGQPIRPHDISTFDPHKVSAQLDKCQIPPRRWPSSKNTQPIAQNTCRHGQMSNSANHELAGMGATGLEPVTSAV